LAKATWTLAERDQVHASAGLVPLGFTGAQVRCNPDHVRNMLATVTGGLRKAA
jgi:hypothetical protein